MVPTSKPPAKLSGMWVWGAQWIHLWLLRVSVCIILWPGWFYSDLTARDADSLIILSLLASDQSEATKHAPPRAASRSGEQGINFGSVTVLVADSGWSFNNTVVCAMFRKQAKFEQWDIWRIKRVIGINNRVADVTTPCSIPKRREELADNWSSCRFFSLVYCIYFMGPVPL